MKLTDVLKRFSGNDDVEQWLDRFEVAVKLTEKPADDAAKKKLMAEYVPLMLDEPAFSTWQQLTDKEKDDFASISDALRRVYGKSISTAWQELKSLRLFPGEPIDVLVTRIQRLLRVASNDKAVSDSMVSLFLLDAIPSRIADNVRMQHGEKMDLTAVTSCVKALLSSSEPSNDFAAGYSQAHNLRGEDPDLGGSPVRSTQRCFGCGRVGHTKNTCRVKCYRCREVGHIQRHCPAVAGNGPAEAVPDHAAPAPHL